ncbi:8-oxo-dGTPase [Tumebacillus sp. BK434]|uniref:NUDIX domain-containing protein n=1 Tax=Tumebacillus sp. BK434 TaxID=2512169 RepID=UPI00104B6688|nr:NUDIX domain-containing protein [Tumebacillus sp. BK434]TCP55374.1 8-oxo-dGTPase [Tumebacillus sp. BK434]
MRYEFAGSYPGQQVRLSFARCDFQEAGYVLVFAFYEGRLLMTRHQKRGWEIPGGTREAGEFTVQTAIREVYEETGAEVCAIEPLGQYVIEADGMAPLVKTIYVAEIGALHPLPEGFETEEVRLFDEPPTPEAVKAGAEYSLILKDDVYAHALERVRGHRFRAR